MFFPIWAEFSSEIYLSIVQEVNPKQIGTYLFEEKKKFWLNAFIFMRTSLYCFQNLKIQLFCCALQFTICISL